MTLELRSALDGFSVYIGDEKVATFKKWDDAVAAVHAARNASGMLARTLGRPS